MLSFFRMIKMSARVAAWATPKVQNWNGERNLNRVEAYYHLEARNWSEAEKYFLAALEEPRRSTVDRLELLLGLAEAQRGEAKLEAAERTAYQAIRLSIADRNEAFHSLALESLADVQLELGQFREAEQTAQEVIHLETARGKPDDSRLASCLGKLAAALEHTDRPLDAIEALKQSAGHAEKAYGPEHPQTAAHLQQLGMLHRRNGHHGAAQSCLRRALEIHRSAVGADSREATQALYNLAGSLEEAGKLNDAAAEFERLLAVRERQVGANPVETADAQVRLATLHLRSNRVSAARELLLQAMPSLERKGGPLYAQALETLASAEERSGHEDAARQCREKAQVAAALHAAG
jgi:tetratricopeptide (TPR) repeat protein